MKETTWQPGIRHLHSTGKMQEFHPSSSLTFGKTCLFPSWFLKRWGCYQNNLVCSNVYWLQVLHHALQVGSILLQRNVLLGVQLCQGWSTGISGAELPAGFLHSTTALLHSMATDTQIQYAVPLNHGFGRCARKILLLITQIRQTKSLKTAFSTGK